jgi:Ca-activated chloride channel family protein
MLPPLFFGQPWFLVLGVGLLAWAVFYQRRIRPHRLRLPLSAPRQAVGGSIWASANTHLLRRLPLILQLLGIIFWILALAKPQIPGDALAQPQTGIDIVLALDVSVSMETPDVQPTRLTVAREITQDILAKRINDRFGLVFFAEEAFTVSPLTTDRTFIQQQVKAYQPGFIPKDGTSLTNALLIGIHRLSSPGFAGRTGALLIITDGVGNMGSINPTAITTLAIQKKIKIFTLGIGSPQFTETKKTGEKVVKQVDYDEATLKELAEKTGGKFFKATDRQLMSKLGSALDRLPRSVTEGAFFRKPYDLYPYCLALGFLCLGTSLGLMLLYLYNPLEG